MTTTRATMPWLSKEFVYSDVDAVGEDAPLLTTLPVAMAFLADPDAEPAVGDWTAGDWLPGTTTARCLAGAGSDAPLTKGVTYSVWLSITGAVEEPVRNIGKLKVT